LAPVESIAPELLVRDENDAVGRLIVRLACAYNDLKTIQHWMENTEPVTAPDISAAERGQRSGFVLHGIRMTASLIFELRKILVDETQTLKMPEVETAVASLPRASRDAWSQFLHAAKDESQWETGSKFWTMRNKSGSHYDRDVVRGFLHGFSTPGFGEGSPAFSDGDSMERTRFYFADVAARATTAALTNLGREATENDVVDQASLVNQAIKPLLVALIRGRMTSASP
jgi:hypothetical protein